MGLKQIGLLALLCLSQVFGLGHKEPHHPRHTGRSNDVEQRTLSAISHALPEILTEMREGGDEGRREKSGERDDDDDDDDRKCFCKCKEGEEPQRRRVSVDQRVTVHQESVMKELIEILSSLKQELHVKGVSHLISTDLHDRARPFVERPYTGPMSLPGLRPGGFQPRPWNPQPWGPAGPQGPGARGPLFQDKAGQQFPPYLGPGIDNLRPGAGPPPYPQQVNPQLSVSSDASTTIVNSKSSSQQQSSQVSSNTQQLTSYQTVQNGNTGIVPPHLRHPLPKGQPLPQGYVIPDLVVTGPDSIATNSQTSFSSSSTSSAASTASASNIASSSTSSSSSTSNSSPPSATPLLTPLPPPLKLQTDQSLDTSSDIKITKQETSKTEVTTEDQTLLQNKDIIVQKQPVVTILPKPVIPDDDLPKLVVSDTELPKLVVPGNELPKPVVPEKDLPVLIMKPTDLAGSTNPVNVPPPALPAPTLPIGPGPPPLPKLPVTVDSSVTVSKTEESKQQSVDIKKETVTTEEKETKEQVSTVITNVDTNVDDEPFKCPHRECQKLDRGFKDENSLLQHLKVVHGEGQSPGAQPPFDQKTSEAPKRPYLPDTKGPAVGVISSASSSGQTTVIESKTDVDEEITVDTTVSQTKPVVAPKPQEPLPLLQTTPKPAGGPKSGPHKPPCNHKGPHGPKPQGNGPYPDGKGTVSGVISSASSSGQTTVIESKTDIDEEITIDTTVNQKKPSTGPINNKPQGNNKPGFGKGKGGDHKCDHHGKQFGSKTDLDNHMNTEHKTPAGGFFGKLGKLDIVGKIKDVFNGKGSGHKCDKHGKTFESKQDLENHLTTEDKVEIGVSGGVNKQGGGHKCDHHGKTFGNKLDFDKHMTTNHKVSKGKGGNCDKHGKVFGSKTDFDSHMTSEHRQEGGGFESKSDRFGKRVDFSKGFENKGGHSFSGGMSASFGAKASMGGSFMKTSSFGTSGSMKQASSGSHGSSGSHAGCNHK